MRILVIGAGAAGGYLGSTLLAAGRDLEFLVRPKTLDRLNRDGLKLRERGTVHTVKVPALTTADLDRPYDIVVFAVRADAVESAARDARPAVGRSTRVVPIMNGLDHVTTLSSAFGTQHVLGAATRLIASKTPAGVVEVVQPGIDMALGQLDGEGSPALDDVADAMAVDGIAVTIRPDIIAAMWEKFAFITSTAVLTCLVGDEIGAVARAQDGIDLARRVLTEVRAIAVADHGPLAAPVVADLEATLTDTSSEFAPSMFRDLRAGRPVETSVLADLHRRARAHHLDTPLLDAAMVVIDVHNRRIAPKGSSG